MQNNYEQQNSLIRGTITKPAYNIQELRRDLINMSKCRIYAEIKEGKLRKSKIGRNTYFLADDIAAWLEAIIANR